MAANGSRWIVCAAGLWGWLAAAPAGAAGQLQEWPQWRGPNRNGVVEGVDLPMPWPKQFQSVWTVSVGEGHSSPVIAQGKVFTLTRQGGDEVALCLSAEDGSELWRGAYPVAYRPVPVARGHGKGPSATSTIAGGKVYTSGITGVLSCFALDRGQLLWRRDFSERFKRTYPLYGCSASPLIDGRLCIISIGGPRRGALAAFDKDSGEPVWEHGGDGPSYASPTVANLAGTRQLIMFMERRLLALSPADGRVLWEWPFETQHVMNIISPIVYKDTVVFAGFRRGAFGVRVKPDGDRFAAEQLWHNRDFSIYMSSPVALDAYLYGLPMRGYGRATLGCVDMRTGELKWSSPRLGQYASIVRVGKKLVVSLINGEVLLVAATPSRYVELGRARVSDQPVWAHIAFAQGKLYVKDRTRLHCYQLSAE